MRELTLDELDQVAGGTQQTTASGDPNDPGDPPTGGGSGGEPPLPPLISMVAPAQVVLQQFFDDLSDAFATHNEYSGSDYDHDSGADYAPYDMQFAPPTHDPSAGVPYWNPNDGIDSELLAWVIDGSQGQAITGTIDVAGAASSSNLAFLSAGQGHVGTYVNGAFLTGVYHPGTAPPPDWSGNQPGDIVVDGGQGGYWTFSIDQTGFVQNSFANQFIPSAPSILTHAGGGYNGTSGYPLGWDVARDHAIDTMAQDLASKIENMTDSSLREYSAYIWRDSNGVLHESTILPGNYNDAGATNASGKMAPMSAYGIPAGATLVALVHNHPQFYTTLNPNTGLITSRTPNSFAKYTDSGDMNSMTETVAHYTTDVLNGINYYRNYVTYATTDGLGNANGFTTDEYDYIQHQTGPIPGPNFALPSAVKGNFNP